MCVVLFEKTFQESGHILQGLVSNKIGHIVQGAAHFVQPDEQPVCLLLRERELQTKIEMHCKFRVFVST